METVIGVGVMPERFALGVLPQHCAINEKMQLLSNGTWQFLNLYCLYCLCVFVSTYTCTCIVGTVGHLFYIIHHFL